MIFSMEGMNTIFWTIIPSEKNCVHAFCIFDHQKAPGKGGHHLGLFDPLTHLLGSGRSGAWPTSQNLGPPVKGIASFRK